MRPPAIDRTSTHTSRASYQHPSNYTPQTSATLLHTSSPLNGRESATRAQGVLCDSVQHLRLRAVTVSPLRRGRSAAAAVWSASAPVHDLCVLVAVCFRYPWGLSPGFSWSSRSAVHRRLSWDPTRAPAAPLKCLSPKSAPSPVVVDWLDLGSVGGSLGQGIVKGRARAWARPPRCMTCIAVTGLRASS